MCGVCVWGGVGMCEVCVGRCRYVWGVCGGGVGMCGVCVYFPVVQD